MIYRLDMTEEKTVLLIMSSLSNTSMMQVLSDL